LRPLVAGSSSGCDRLGVFASGAALGSGWSKKLCSQQGYDFHNGVFTFMALYVAILFFFFKQHRELVWDCLMAEPVYGFRGSPSIGIRFCAKGVYP
jgi:hypothetical protein